MVYGHEERCDLAAGRLSPKTAALMDVRDHPYASFLRDVKKLAQYLGGEHGEKGKDWDAVSCRMCLAFPDVYEIGMSHLGYKILYGILNKHDKLLAERAYAPWIDMEAELRKRNEPLRSLESWRPLSDFDVVGFSLQFELTYTNILTMMDLGGIPLRSADRGEDDPLIVCGGPVATHAEPLGPFVDVFLIGDGEEKTAELMLTWASLRDAGVPRAERLKALAGLGGFFVPSLYERRTDADTGFLVVDGPKENTNAPYPVERAILRDLKKFPFPHDGPVAATETIFDRVSVEVARGCTEGCRFCQAGMIYRPVRERDPKAIVDTIVNAVREGGYDEASLTSLSTADYSAIEPLVHEVMAALKGERVNVSVSSLRAYGLSEAVLDDMKTQRAGGLTFAPEAGTQRMRDVVNKNVTEAQLMETAERVFSRGWNKMKLYFMIGLPTEEDEDVAGIVQTGGRARQVARRVRGRNDAKVTVSVSSHVPKPHTPFQWCAMDPHEELVRKQEILRTEAKRTKVQLRMHDSSGSWLEGVLARGDERLANVIENAWRKGARFDSWNECLRLDAWEEAFAEAGIETSDFLGTIPVSARLPWDHIDVGLEEGFLAKEYRKALKNRLSPPCGKVAGTFTHHTNLEEAHADTRRLVCYDCGVACDMSKMRGDRMVALERLGAEKPRLPLLAEVAEVAEEKQSESPSVSAQPQDPRGPTPTPNGVAAAANGQAAPADGTRPEGETPNKVAKAPGRMAGRADHEVAQGPAARIRIGFAKVGRIAFSSHLDLVRLFPRWFKRVGLPVYWSGGFHPRPQMTFAPALSLGISGTGEYVDVKVRERDFGTTIPADFVERLQRTAFEGIEVFGAAMLGPQDASLGRILGESVWVAGFAKDALQTADLLEDTEKQLEESKLARHIEQRLAGPLVGTRIRKGIGRKVDVGRVLHDVALGEGRDTLAKAGILGDLIPLRFATRMDDKGSAKPTEVIEALLGDVPCRLVREGVYAERDGARISPLDLVALRQPKAPGATDNAAATTGDQKKEERKSESGPLKEAASPA